MAMKQQGKMIYAPPTVKVVSFVVEDVMTSTLGAPRINPFDLIDRSWNDDVSGSRGTSQFSDAGWGSGESSTQSYNIERW